MFGERHRLSWEQSPDRPVTLKHNLGHNQELFVKIDYHLLLKSKFEKLQGEVPHLIRIVISESSLRRPHRSRKEQSLSFMNLRQICGECLTSESYLVYHMPKVSKLCKRLMENERAVGRKSMEGETEKSTYAPSDFSLPYVPLMWWVSCWLER